MERRANKAFTLGFIMALIISGALWMLLAPSEQIFRTLNGHYSRFGDSVMPYITYLGDGLSCLIAGLLVILLAREGERWRGSAMIAGFAVSGILVQLLKKFVFHAHKRPHVLYGEESWLHVVQGVSLYSNNSFPSGHTTTAFMLAVLLAFMGRSMRWSALWLGLACLAGYSRIYLAQHHFEDVYAGMIIGAACGAAVYYYFYPRKHRLPRRLR